MIKAPLVHRLQHVWIHGNLSRPIRNFEHYEDLLDVTLAHKLKLLRVLTGNGLMLRTITICIASDERELYDCSTILRSTHRMEAVPCSA